MTIRFDQSFYSQPAPVVARALLGQRFVRILDGQRIAGIITETEAYCGEEDQACHARAGRTPRTEVMYGSPGHAYVYFTYGMHWMFNFVCASEGFPAAVLLRAILPTEGLEIIAARRSGQPKKQWTNGPAKICQALAINGDLNDRPLYKEESIIWVEQVQTAQEENVRTTARIGIPNVPEPWRSVPWRFLLCEEA